MLRKSLASILILTFFSLQYGKIASYWYCKWQAELQQLTDCGCETHLEEHFADGGLHDAPLDSIKASFSEFTLTDTWEIKSSESCSYSVVNGFLTNNLPDPHPEAEFRPPIL
jgi:hypothetical protein